MKKTEKNRQNAENKVACNCVVQFPLRKIFL